MYKIGELTTVSMGKSIGTFTGYPLIKGIEIIKMFKFEADAIEYLNKLNSKLEKKNDL
jgi:hypothetical protein